MATDVEIPITLPLAAVLYRLTMGRTTMDRLLAGDVFTVIAPDGRGPGKRLFLVLAEVEVYDRTRSEAAVKAYREKVAAELHPVDVGGEP